MFCGSALSLSRSQLVDLWVGRSGSGEAGRGSGNVAGVKPYIIPQKSYQLYPLCDPHQIPPASPVLTHFRSCSGFTESPRDFFSRDFLYSGGCTAMHSGRCLHRVSVQRDGLPSCWRLAERWEVLRGVSHGPVWETLRLLGAFGSRCLRWLYSLGCVRMWVFMLIPTVQLRLAVQTMLTC